MNFMMTTQELVVLVLAAAAIAGRLGYFAGQVSTRRRRNDALYNDGYLDALWHQHQLDRGADWSEPRPAEWEPDGVERQPSKPKRRRR